VFDYIERYNDLVNRDDAQFNLNISIHIVTKI
jgi:hypothetical protein